MPPFDECCVLIPAATLEDFPSDLSDSDARSLLAAWTVLWHPSLLAHTEQIPVWYRADGPPDPIGARLLAVPAPSLAQLPDGYETRARQSEECRWISGGSRAEMAEMLQLDAPPVAEGRHRGVAVEDFYAAGFAALQIQVMTRRLRYTSNLDEIHLQNRIVAAAKSFLDGAAEDAIEALHDVFDCLAEERDHYFSSDPHLIDLTLTSQSTIEPLLESIAETDPVDAPGAVDAPGDDSDAESSLLKTPSNLLIDVDAAEAIANFDPSRSQRLREILSSGALGWAGGGPAADVCLDAMTFAEADSAFTDAYVRTEQALGMAPRVYGRFCGSTPSDMTPTLARLGYVGMIPLDFANGSGHGDEAKVIMQSAGARLEALTAKPIDAASDASFLTLGARLGEAIDSGEIATALLVHWPTQACEAMADLRRVASWSLSLGRFWKLDEYFRDGEHPYHHAAASAASTDAGQLLESMVQRGRRDPISSLASSFRQNVIDESNRVIAAMTTMVTGKANTEGDVAAGFASAITGTASGKGTVDGSGDGSVVGESSLLINPHAIGCRDSITLAGAAPKSAPQIYASSHQGGKATTTVDIPAYGFVVMQGRKQATGNGHSFADTVRRKIFGRPKMIAEEGRLRNEFMEVAVSSESGGISGVYSGSARGNRFSLRLVRNRSQQNDSGDETVMRCNDLRIVASTAEIGCIETGGEISDAKGGAKLATFRLRYSLHRGSRVVEVEGELTPTDPPQGNPWTDYFACRVAVVMEAAIYRALLRDKVHRTKSRRLVSPLGVVIDEAERQTLVGAAGLAFHRKVGDRFLDTLLVTQGESNSKFKIFYGFDVPFPVATARSLIAPPVHVPIKAASNVTEIGWILNSAPKEISISSLTVDRRRDGRLAAILRVIQTRSQSRKATLRFFRNVQGALRLDGPCDDPLNHPLPVDETDNDQPNQDASDDGSAKDPSTIRLNSHDDLVSFEISGHGVVDVLVVFVADAAT